MLKSFQHSSVPTMPHCSTALAPSSSTTSLINEDPPCLIRDVGLKQDYQRGKLLGKGGFAKVYEVTELSNGKKTKFADKIIHKDVFQKKKSSREKVRKEIELHRGLAHVNIVRLINYFEDQSFVHIILEYCSLKSLLHLMKDKKVLGESDVRFFMHQICHGVRYIHCQGIIHRDLKLGNMFLTGNMCVKIGDFGLATLLKDSAGDPSQLGNKSSSSSGGHTLCGTPNYIAPEVLLKKGHTRETDLWAMGCMTYAMLIGNPPFETKSLNETYTKIANNDYFLSSHLSAPVTSFIRKLLHPLPAMRGNLLHHLPGGGNGNKEEDLLNHEFLCAGREPNGGGSSSLNKNTTFLSRRIIPNGSNGSPSSSPSSSSILVNPVISDLSLTLKDIAQITNAIIKHLKDTLTAKAVHQELFRAPNNLPMHIIKWIDYSNKYGFGYQLADKSLGTLLVILHACLLCNMK